MDKVIIQTYNPSSKTDSNYLTCQFNPETLRIEKRVTWSAQNQAGLNAPDMTFTGGESATFSIVLWFDTTTLNNQDVRGYTNKLLKLTLKAEGENTPPIVRLVWGSFKTFHAIVTSVTIEYTMFLTNGLPVRAKATVAFQQASDGDSGRLPGQNPTSRTDPRKTYRVHQGDRIDFLAFREYGDSTQWRRIAEANGLDNPLDLKPGQILIVPPED